MAGLGARLFPAFSKLTSAQVNGYLMDQTIMRFASTAARDAAFGGAGEPTLAEGMTCYLDDTNVLQSYNGSAWVTVASSSAPTGLQLVKTQTIGTNVGGTINIPNAFSQEFDNYKITLSGTTTNGIANIEGRMGTGTSGNNYFSTRIRNFPNNGTPAGNGQDTTASWGYFGQAGVGYAHLNVDLFSPFLEKRTVYSGAYMIDNGSASEFGITQGHLATNTSYSSMDLLIGGGVLLTGGAIRVYGYRN
jgi:hypothetical protein